MLNSARFCSFFCIAGRPTCIATKLFRATTRFGVRLFLTDNKAIGDGSSNESERYICRCHGISSDGLLVQRIFLLFVHHRTSPKSTLSFVTDATSAATDMVMGWVSPSVELG